MQLTIFYFAIFSNYSYVDLDNYEENSVWKMESATTEVKVLSGTPSVYIEYTLKRKPSYYIFNIILPVVVLGLLDVFAFVLPVSSGERAGFSITVFLTFAIFLTIIGSALPVNSENVCVLSVYLMVMTIFSVLVVMVSLFQIRLASREEGKEIGRGYMFLYHLSKKLQCRQSKVGTKDSSSVKSFHEKEISDDEAEAPSWNDIVNALDYILFWTSAIFVFLVTLVILAVAGAH